MISIIACSANESQDDAPDWFGTQPHFTMTGNLAGESFDIEFSGQEAEGRTEDDDLMMRCRRKYYVPDPDDPLTYADGSLFKYEIEIRDASFLANILGGLSELELEVFPHAFHKDAPGTELTVVPRDDANPLPLDSSEIWFEAEWFDLNALKTAVSAIDGVFVIHEQTGTPTQGVVIPASPDSIVGGTYRVQWSVTEVLEGSFTARCAKEPQFTPFSER